MSTCGRGKSFIVMGQKHGSWKIGILLSNSSLKMVTDIGINGQKFHFGLPKAIPLSWLFIAIGLHNLNEKCMMHGKCDSFPKSPHIMNMIPTLLKVQTLVNLMGHEKCHLQVRSMQIHFVTNNLFNIPQTSFAFA